MSKCLAWIISTRARRKTFETRRNRGSGGFFHVRVAACKNSLVYLYLFDVLNSSVSSFPLCFKVFGFNTGKEDLF
jgi:hypothetical protein